MFLFLLFICYFYIIVFFGKIWNYFFYLIFWICLWIFFKVVFIWMILFFILIGFDFELIVLILWFIFWIKKFSFWFIGFVLLSNWCNLLIWIFKWFNFLWILFFFNKMVIFVNKCVLFIWLFNYLFNFVLKCWWYFCLKMFINVCSFWIDWVNIVI